MDSVNKTLYIPLYGKAYVSKRGIILHDPVAESIWEAEGFPLKRKARSKWLAYYMAMRASVFDSWVKKQMDADPDAVVLHIGCGMDSRCFRVDAELHEWFDIDFPDVIRERKRYFQDTDRYHMLGADVSTAEWLNQLPAGNAIVVMEGVSMYLRPDQLKGTLDALCEHFDRVRLLMDCYTKFAAKASRLKNPINSVGVTNVYGIDDPKILEGKGLSFIREGEMTPDALVNELSGREQKVFRMVYAGSVAKKLYRLYEYEG